MPNRTGDPADTTPRHDAVLAGIPLAFGVSFLLELLTVLGSAGALGLASIASGVLMVDALFLNPP